MKVTDILPRKCYILEYHNKAYNVPIYRSSWMPKSLLIKCPAHLGDSPMTQQSGICLQCRRCRRCGFDPWVRKIPWSRKWQLTQVFLPGEHHGQKSLEGYGPCGHKKSDMTEDTCMLHVAHLEFMDFRKKPLKSSLKKKKNKNRGAEEKKGKDREQTIGKVNVERERRKPGQFRQEI